MPAAAAPAKLALSTRTAHMGVTGAVRVAARALSGSCGGLRRSMDDGGLPRRGYAARRLSGEQGSSRGSSGGGGGAAQRPPASDAAVARAAVSAADAELAKDGA